MINDSVIDEPQAILGEHVNNDNKDSDDNDIYSFYYNIKLVLFWVPSLPPSLITANSTQYCDNVLQETDSWQTHTESLQNYEVNS